MSRKVFTAGEVLAASDVNSFLMDQTVMSFAGTAARGSAIPSPVTGMYTHLEDSNPVPRLQFWNGSAWASPFGLTLINETVFSGQASVTVNGVFSNTYKDYLIRYRFDQTTNFSDSSFTLVNGATPSASQWGWSGSLIAASQALVGFTNFDNNGVRMPLANMNSGGNDCSGTIMLDSPFLANETTGSLDQFCTSTGNGANDTRKLGFALHNGTSYEGFRLQVAAGTISGSFRIYGLRNS
jgi:hypothetical protein